MNKPKVFDGVTIYPAAVEGKTLKEFIEHEKHHGFTDEQATDIYNKMSPAEKQADVKAPSKEKAGK